MTAPADMTLLELVARRDALRERHADVSRALAWVTTDDEVTILGDAIGHFEAEQAAVDRRLADLDRQLDGEATGPYRALYAEAAAQRARYDGRAAMMPGRERPLGQFLEGYIADVLRRRPGASCSGELEVAYWLQRLIVTAGQWQHAWDAVALAAAR